MNMRPTTTATLLLMAAFLGGLLSGVLLERTIFGSVAEAHAATEVPAPPEGRPADRTNLVLQLDLTAEQQEAIDSILAEQQQQIRAILGETRPQTRAVLKETRERVDQVLTPEQRDRLRELHREARRQDGTKRNH
jgi:Spy/CpxP family protein refolding chaperone